MTTKPMGEAIVHCDQHGAQGIGLMCVHAAAAIGTGEQPGLFWADESADTARPDAWCQACEQVLLEHGWREAWFEQAQFKILCQACWDQGRAEFGTAHTQGDL